MTRLFITAVIIFTFSTIFFSPIASSAEVVVEMTCDIPTTRTDGTALSVNDIGGYRFYESTDSVNFQLAHDAATPSNCGANLVYNLDVSETPYTYYYAATTYDIDGRESSYSNIVKKTFLLKSTANPSPPGLLSGSIVAGPGYVVIEQ